MNSHSVMLRQRHDPGVVLVFHQGPRHGGPCTADSGLQLACGLDEGLEQCWSVDAAAARGDDEGALRCSTRPVSRRSCSPEIAAVVEATREVVVEPVGLDEVEHPRIAVDADCGVVLPQHLVHTRLPPNPTDECRLVEDVAKARHRPTAAAFELLQRRQKLAIRACGHEVGDQKIRRYRSNRALEKVGTELDHVPQRQRQLAGDPGAPVDLL